MGSIKFYTEIYCKRHTYNTDLNGFFLHYYFVLLLMICIYLKSITIFLDVIKLLLIKRPKIIIRN